MPSLIAWLVIVGNGILMMLATDFNILTWTTLEMGRSIGIGIGKYRLKFMVSGSDQYFSTDTKPILYNFLNY